MILSLSFCDSDVTKRSIANVMTNVGVSKETIVENIILSQDAVEEESKNNFVIFTSTEDNCPKGQCFAFFYKGV